MLELKFKKLHDDVIIPKKAHETDACFDVYSPIDIVLPAKSLTRVPLGFSVQCPMDFKLCFYSRSSMGAKGIWLGNSIGIIDEDYRGECMAVFYNSGDREYDIRKGDRILQCALEKVYYFEIKEVEELSKTKRGEGGFGSSGK